MTDIAIQLPLPMSVSATLMNLVGAAWPDAEMVNNKDGILTGGRHMVLRVPDRPARTPEPDAIAAAIVEPGTDDVDLLELGPQGISISRPQQMSAMMLQVMIESFAENPDAVNYLENKVRDPDTGNEYVLIFARSSGQTPHELRMAAEQRVDSVHATVHREVTETLQALLGPKADHAAGTYHDGVREALESVRQLNFSRID